MPQIAYEVRCSHHISSFTRSYLRSPGVGTNGPKERKWPKEARLGGKILEDITSCLESGHTFHAPIQAWLLAIRL